jgi:uncharacterized coiled-coil protein SlyX
MEQGEKRLTELEIRFTHQEVLIDELSELIRSQQSQIDYLVRSAKQLAARVELTTDEAEKPPHY